MDYRFDDFVLSPDGPGLTCKGEAVQIEPLVLRLLTHLVTHHERIVSKDELIEAIWDGRIISDAALNTAIRSARRALGDDREQQRYIRTFPKRGFQFVGQLSEADEAQSVSGSIARPRTTRSPLRWGVLLLLFFMAVGSWWWRVEQESQHAALALPDRPSLAVLRFDNLSQDPAQQYFVDGLVEDLIGNLALNRDLFVISPKSTFAYDAAATEVPDIARDLGVAYILRGSLRREDGRVRIAAELVDGQSGETLWSERFDRSLTDILALQEEISRTIAGRIAPEVTRARVEATRNDAQVDLNAWDTYLRAKAAQTRFTPEDQAEAVRLAILAIQADPNFAAPYAVLSKAKGVQFFHQWTETPDSTLGQAIDNGRKAIQLDGDDPAAYAALGYVYRLTGDENRSIGHLERARDLNPNNASIRLELAHALDWFRLQDRALPEIEEAIRLSPRDPRLELMYFYKAHILFHLQDYEASLAATDKMAGVLTTDTWRSFYHMIRAANLAYLSDLDTAGEEIEAARAIKPGLSLAAIRKRFEGSKNHPENRRIWLDALGKAGMPES